MLREGRRDRRRVGARQDPHGRDSFIAILRILKNPSIKFSGLIELRQFPKVKQDVTVDGG
jgi:hypothetical protein